VRRLALIVGAVLVLLVLGIAQLVLPGLAADRLRDQLSHHGQVLSVSVSAFPAIELLWHHADRVTVRMASYSADTGTLGSSVAQAGDVGTLDASASTVTAGLLTLHGAELHKRGGQLTGTAEVQEADLLRAVPFLTDVHPVSGSDPAHPGPLVLQGSASLLGISATADATVTTSNGKIVVTPQVPFGGLATVTVFDNRHVSVDSVAATASAAGFSLRARGHVR
jgi:uncharacterized protein involved in outer membrane biogenesis